MTRHLSSEEITNWMIGERTREMERHARECPPCRAELSHLEDSFRLFRESSCGAGWQPAADWQSSTSGISSIPRLTGAVLLAASVLLCALLIQNPSPAPRPPTQSIIEEPFVRIPYVAPLAPYERTNVMRMEVPVAALIAAGFEVHMPDAAAAVRADVLFGQDGRAHAIRLVPNSKPYSDRRLD